MILAMTLDSTRILVDKRGAAAALGICVRMLEKLVRRGEIETVRIGDRVLFFRSSLEDFARSRRHKRGMSIIEFEVDKD